MHGKWITKIKMLFCSVSLAYGSLSAQTQTINQQVHATDVAFAAPYAILHVTQTVLDAGIENRKISVKPGDRVAFKVLITNSGGVTAEDVLLAINVPEGLTVDGYSLWVDGKAMSLPLKAPVSNNTLICHGLSIPALGLPTEIYFSADVNAPPPPGVTRLKNRVEVFCSRHLDTGENPLDMWVSTKSNAVHLIFPEPNITPFPVLTVTHAVETEEGHAVKKTRVKPGDHVMLTTTIMNTGDRSGKCSFTTHLPLGLKYVKNSFRVNGKFEEGLIVSGQLIAYWPELQAHSQPGDTVTLSFKVKVAKSPPADVKTFKTIGQLLYEGNPRLAWSVASSNTVKLILESP